MLTRIPGLPATVVGVEARERVTAGDYERVLVPAVEAAAAASSDGKVRVLYVLGREFPDFTAGAVWADAKLALAPRRRWERIAVVSDAVWLRRAIRVVGWAIPGEVRVYASDQLNDARVWVTSPRPGQRCQAVLRRRDHRVSRAQRGAPPCAGRGVWSAEGLGFELRHDHRVGIDLGRHPPCHRSAGRAGAQGAIQPDRRWGLAHRCGVLSEVIDKVTTRRAKATASTAALIVFAVVVRSIHRPVLRSFHAIRATIRVGITEVRKVRDEVSRYGAEDRGRRC